MFGYFFGRLLFEFVVYCIKAIYLLINVSLIVGTWIIVTNIKTCVWIVAQVVKWYRKRKGAQGRHAYDS